MTVEDAIVEVKVLLATWPQCQSKDAMKQLLEHAEQCPGRLNSTVQETNAVALVNRLSALETRVDGMDMAYNVQEERITSLHFSRDDLWRKHKELADAVLTMRTMQLSKRMK